jgi:hypothetical protein
MICEAEIRHLPSFHRQNAEKPIDAEFHLIIRCTQHHRQNVFPVSD